MSTDRLMWLILAATFTVAVLLCVSCSVPPGCRALDDRVVCEPGPNSPVATVAPDQGTEPR